MANLSERRDKNGKLISFAIRAYVGRSADGKIMFENTSFPVDSKWKESTARKKAEAYAATFERDIKKGVLSNENRTFEDYAQYVIRLKETTGTCKRTTLDNYRMILRKIAPIIGFVKLKELRPDHLNQLYIGLTDGKITGKKLQPKSIQNIHGFISAVLEQADRDGIVVRNVAHRAIPPKIPARDPETLEVSQLEILMDTLKAEPMRWRAAMLLLINTGMRRGELFGLKWDKIDLNTGTLEIANNLLRSRETHELYEDTPKTKASKRVLRLPSDMVSFLKQYKAWQNAERLRLGEYYQDHGWVFAKDNGDPMHPDSLTNYCVKLSKRLGFHVHPHLFRHTQASILIANGVPITAVSKRLGHSQTSTTMNIYAHALKNADEENVKVLETVLSHHN
jgi:integrase